MNVWEALADREIDIPGNAEGMAFAFLFGAVEGFGKESYEGDIRGRLTSEALAMILHDALDYYEAHRDE